MAMFEYFKKNYVWNLSIAIAMESGARIGEIVDMCRPLTEAAKNGDDANTDRFLVEWVKMADKLVDLADEDEAKGRALSASAKLKRASLYYLTAERMQAQGAPARRETFAKAQSAFRKYVDLGHINAERVEIPYQGGYLAGLLTRPRSCQGSTATVVYVNGLDSSKEMLFWSGLPDGLAQRDIATLTLDQPGTGEALRLQNFPATCDTERWATPVFDWLAAREDVDAGRIGITGVSLGGYYAPRAAAMEPRFASVAVWGANQNWAEVQRKRLNREGENPVPHYWAHVMWVFGATSMEDFLEKSAGMTLNGIMDRIKVPFLVLHGENDRQISVDYARQCYDQLINSPRRELKIITPREGGVEHVSMDNIAFACDYIADWFAETLGGSTN